MSGSGTSVLLIVHHGGNARVLAQAVTEIGREAIHVDSFETLNAHLAANAPAQAALVDVAGFGQTVWSMCSVLHENEIPFVVISPQRDHVAGNRSLEYGASSVLQKPVAKEGLLSLLRSLSEP